MDSGRWHITCFTACREIAAAEVDTVRLKTLLRTIPGVGRAARRTRLFREVVHDTWRADRAGHFEMLTRRDEWTFETPVERERHRRVRDAVAAILGTRPWGAVLEVGCADGCFTAELARLATSVTACDISPTACERARDRCRTHRNVQVRTADVIDGQLAGSYDVVFAMDVLDYVHGRRQVSRAVGRLVGVLRPGGLLVVTTFRVPVAQQVTCWAKWLVGGGENLRRFVERRFPLSVIHRDVHAEPGSAYPEHLILVFRKERVTGPAD